MAEVRSTELIEDTPCPVFLNDRKRYTQWELDRYDGSVFGCLLLFTFVVFFQLGNQLELNDAIYLYPLITFVLAFGVSWGIAAKFHHKKAREDKDWVKLMIWYYHLQRFETLLPSPRQGAVYYRIDHRSPDSGRADG